MIVDVQSFTIRGCNTCPGQESRFIACIMAGNSPAVERALNILDSTYTYFAGS